MKLVMKLELIDDAGKGHEVSVVLADGKDQLKSVSEIDTMMKHLDFTDQIQILLDAE